MRQLNDFLVQATTSPVVTRIHVAGELLCGWVMKILFHKTFYNM